MDDNSIDAIISAFGINRSPEKAWGFTEAWRVSKPGGRRAISEIVASAELPTEARQYLVLYTSCMAGASTIGALECDAA